MKKKIVFSDLHCQIANWPLCEQILRHIHGKAVELDAEVVFSGDFFDKTWVHSPIALCLFVCLL